MFRTAAPLCLSVSSVASSLASAARADDPTPLSVSAITTAVPEVLIHEHAGPLLLLAGLLGIGLYYLLALSRTKLVRDTAPRVIVPLSTPPAGLGPAEARFIWKQRFDDAAFASALIGLAVKGRITIDDDGRDFAIHKTLDDSAALTNVEAALYGALPDETTRLKRTAQLTLLSLRSEVRRALKVQYEGVLFQRNLRWFWSGASSSTLLLAGVATLLPVRDASIGFALLGWWSLWWGVALGLGWEDFERLYNARANPRAARAFRRLGFYLPLLIAGAAVPLIVLTVADSPTLYVVVIAGLALLALNLLFFRLLRAPTLAGRVILDQLEGFRLYLTNKPPPAPDAAGLFESYLPYALAMDCERAWNARFHAVLAGVSGPRWYSGRRWNRARSGAGEDGLGSLFSSRLSAASGAPGSNPRHK